MYRSGEPFVSSAYRVVINRGPAGAPEECFFHMVNEPLRGDDGRVEGVVLVATEVTELVASRRRAEEASRAKDEFLAMLGHELRNPLAPLVTALHLMKLRAPATLERERAIIERQVKNLSRLVDDLLDVSRIARGKVELRRDPTELAGVVAQGIETASPLIESRRHRLTVDVPASGLRVLGDIARLAQVVSNLLTNAAKYTDPGGNLRVRAWADGGQAVLQVSDDGIGIAPELLPQVFDLFFQARQGSDRALGGLGLGLALVRSLVELHGGTVAAESAGPGRGSTFTVRLPLLATRERGEASGRTEQGTARRPRGRLRVLVVDDNVDAAESLRDFFALLGHDVDVGHDGPGGLRLAEQRPPDLALLDLGLPGMDGLELARRVRVVAPDAYLVAATGYGQESDRRASREAGFDRHLVKPLGVDELEMLVHEQETRRAAERARESLAGPALRRSGAQGSTTASLSGPCPRRSGASSVERSASCRSVGKHSVPRQVSGGRRCVWLVESATPAPGSPLRCLTAQVQPAPPVVAAPALREEPEARLHVTAVQRTETTTTAARRRLGCGPPRGGAVASGDPWRAPAGVRTSGFARPLRRRRRRGPGPGAPARGRTPPSP